MAKFLLFRPRSLCLCFILLALATLVLIFQYQNGSQGSLRARPPALPLHRSGTEDKSDENLAKIIQGRSGDVYTLTGPKTERPHQVLNRPPATCSVQLERNPVDIDTTEVYASKLDFGNVDSTYWNAAWEERWKKRRAEPNSSVPLRVIVIPHSHNDPGWLQTFEMYFDQKTSRILDNALSFLAENADFRFVWSEMSFFARWWATTLEEHPQEKQQIKELIARGQLELLTGGWVMTDEAGVNLYSMLDQLVEGHQWIKHHLGPAALPKNGWSIDPFGHGNAVPYLLSKSGIHNAFIQRTHYAWKRWLADRQQLEFAWERGFRQKKAPLSEADAGRKHWRNRDQIMCHMAPFDLYSIKHTCGPDTSVCLRFDFRRLHGEHSESRSEPVTAANVHQLAVDLVEQYSKLASLFSHNVAVVPLGDDFRYDRGLEWEQQYKNYRQLFTYINSNPSVFGDAHVSFGTLAEYWNEVYRRQRDFPKLSGDFMPYGDVYSEGQANYWTGYFTTRPFMKQLARELQHYLRAAEIVYALGRHHLLGLGGHEQLRSRLDADYLLLSGARQQLGIFQHHDAVTGTSKAFVMRDYGKRLYRGIEDTSAVIAHVVQYLQTKHKPLYQSRGERGSYDENYRQEGIPFRSYLQMSERRMSVDELPTPLLLRLKPSSSTENLKNSRARPEQDSRNGAGDGSQAKVVVFNSHAHTKQEAIRVHVSGPVQKVKGPRGQDLPFQLNPVWGYTPELPTGRYELLFIADLAPLSTTTFEVFSQAPGETSDTPATRIKLFMSDSWEKENPLPAKPTLSDGHLFNFESSSDEDITIMNGQVHAVFSRSSGFLKSLNGRSVSFSFGAYRSADFHSGAYLFRPDPREPKLNISERFPVVRLVRGPLMSEVIVVYPHMVMQRARVYHQPPGTAGGPLMAGLFLETEFDLSVRKDFMELYLELQTDIASGQEFFTDSGGFEVVRRIRNDLLPIEANYYPMTEAALIQDASTRLTVLADHAHGVSSAKPGQLELMLERKLRFDDARGLGEGVMDNRQTQSRFWLLLEDRKKPETGKVPGAESVKGDRVTLLSGTAHSLVTMLNFPPVVLQSLPNVGSRETHAELSFLSGPLSCDVHLLGLRTLPADSDYNRPSADRVLLVLQSRTPDCSVEAALATEPYCRPGPGAGLAFSNVTVEAIRRSSLTGTAPEGESIPAEEVAIEPHQLESFILTFGKPTKDGNAEGLDGAAGGHPKLDGDSGKLNEVDLKSRRKIRGSGST